jgi:hypothetical protein
MSHIGTSELQFAFTFFAKFNELNNYQFRTVVVPTQRQEGDPGYQYNGADLVLDEYFLQFKSPENLVKKNAFQWKDFNQPYFRFNVYNTPSDRATGGQLDFLMRHCTGMNKVYYCVPCFNNLLNIKVSSPTFWYRRFYSSRANELSKYSLFIDISSIDPSWVRHDDESIICYTADEDFAYFYSEPKNIRVVDPVETIKQNRNNSPRRLSSVLINLLDDIGERPPQSSSNQSISNEKPVDLLAYTQKIVFQRHNVIWLPKIIATHE